jgi:hypothetical protein
MFLKCYHYLHSMIEFVGCVNQTSDEDFNLDIFNRLYPQMSHQKNLSLRNYWFLDVTKWIPKTSSVLFNGGENIKSHVSYVWFFSSSNLKHCKVINWNKNNFLLSEHTYKPKEMLFIIKKFRKIHNCEQKLTKWSYRWM